MIVKVQVLSITTKYNRRDALIYNEDHSYYARCYSFDVMKKMKGKLMAFFVAHQEPDGMLKIGPMTEGWV